MCGGTTLTGPYHSSKVLTLLFVVDIYNIYKIQKMIGVLWDFDGEHPASWPYAEMKIKQVATPRKNRKLI